MTSHNLRQRRPDPFDEENARRACTCIGEQFLVQVQLAELAMNAQRARNKAKKARLPTLSPSQAVTKHFIQHKAEYPELAAMLESDDVDMSKLKEEIAILYAQYLA
jgi:hypothetical protein